MRKSFQFSTRYYFLTIGIVLFIVFTTMRGFTMLGPLFAQPLLPLSFVLMTLVPFVLLRRADRTVLGLRKPTSCQSYFTAVVLGSMAAFVCYIVGISIFQLTPDNWYVTIKTFYLDNPAYDNTSPIWQTFLIFSLPALIFSPVGEEIFFRGFLQESLKLNFSERTSTLIECACFGVIHLFHHGLVSNKGRIIFFPLSGLIWALLMASLAFVFVQIRKHSNSLYPAMASHAAFNLSMNVIIFFMM